MLPPAPRNGFPARRGTTLGASRRIRKLFCKSRAPLARFPRLKSPVATHSYVGVRDFAARWSELGSDPW